MSRNKYNFDIEAKGQCHAEVMNVCDTSSYDDALMCKIYGPNTNHVNNPIYLTLGSKVNTWISHADRPMCSIWYADVKANRSYGSNTKNCQKNWPWGQRSMSYPDNECMWHASSNLVRQCRNKKKGMDRTRICTDRRTDRVIPI